MRSPSIVIDVNKAKAGLQPAGPSARRPKKVLVGKIAVVGLIQKWYFFLLTLLSF